MNTYGEFWVYDKSGVLANEFTVTDNLAGMAVSEVVVTEGIVLGSSDATDAAKRAEASAVEAKKSEQNAANTLNDAVKKSVTGTQTINSTLVSKGDIEGTRIKSNSQIEVYDSTGVYGQRLVTANGITYLQGGKVDRDATDQRMSISGWYGTPLSEFRIMMAAGTQPKVRIDGASTYDILHRGNYPTAEEVKAMAVYERPPEDDCNNALVPR